jgi:sodium transport system ATP-binding protein
VAPGEIVGILGENGAGKTTTLRMIAGILQPTGGGGSVNGFDITTNPQRVRGEIGTLLGCQAGLYDRLTAKENILYFADLNDVPRERSLKRIDELSKLLGMEEYLNKRTSTFSHGMKQKTAIARAIVHNPPVMLLDEPTSGLDVLSTKIVRYFINQCRKEQKATLFSSHAIEEIEILCDRVVIIHQGKLVEEGSISEIKDKYSSSFADAFLQLMGGEHET